MPIVVPCPGCPAQLSAPDSAAGKQIRCPKCKAVATVPGFVPAEEVPVVEAAVVPRPKARPPVDDDDERPRPRRARPRRAEEDDDERPRRRKRKTGGGVIALVVVGGLLLLVGVGGGIYLLAGKGGLFTKRAPVPPGWQQYSYPQDGFKAYFPRSPSVLTRPGIGAGAHLPFRGEFPEGNELQAAESHSKYSCGEGAGTAWIHVHVVRYRNSVPAAVRDQMRRSQTVRVGENDLRVVRWLGYDATEFGYSGGVSRTVCTDRMLIGVSITGPDGPGGARAKPEEEAAFFDNFQLTR